MADEFEGSEFALILIEQETGLRTKEAAPAGVRLPFDSASGKPGRAAERHDQITGLQAPSLPLTSLIDPSLSVTAAANINSLGWWLRHALAIGDTTGAGAPYTHIFGLGNDNGMPIGHEIAMQSAQAGITNVSRLYWGGRIQSFGFSIEAKGALMLDIAMEFLHLDPWAAAAEVALPTEYDDEPQVDLGIGVFNVGGAPKGYLANLKGTIDRKLGIRHPACNAGVRSNVARGVPQAGGSFSVYCDDNVVTDLIAAAETRPPTPTDLSFSFVLDAGPPLISLTIALNNAYLYQTEESVKQEGVDASFDWVVGGVDCIQFTISNTVTGYAPA